MTEGRDVLSVRWIALGVLLSVALRLRMVVTPLSTDEGGYVAIGRAWGHGAVLYRDVWVDRPQGLLLTFRLLDTVTGAGTVWVRIMAIMAGAVLVVATAVVAGVLSGRVAASVAAVCTAALTASPVVEGHTANAELLSGAAAAAGLALGVWVLWRPDPDLQLVWSGLLAGVALSMKQSGFDGLAVMVVAIVALGVVRRSPWRQVTVRLGWLAAGVAAVLAALAVHGAATGWSRWWYAMAGYRLDARSVGKGADWNRLGVTVDAVRASIGPLLLVALVGGLVVLVAGVFRRRRGWRPGREVLLFVWLAVALASFLVGGQFFRHYYVLLGAPLAAAAAAVLTRVRPPVLRAVLVVAVLAPGLVDALDILRLDRDAAAVASTTDPRLAHNEDVAEWFDEHGAPGETMYAMCASAAMYAEIGTDPPYPYLWWDAVLQIPGALPTLRSWLGSADAPEYIAQYFNLASCDPTGEVGRIVDERYARVTQVGTVPILELQPGR